jgi:hypothetical protein
VFVYVLKPVVHEQQDVLAKGLGGFLRLDHFDREFELLDVVLISVLVGLLSHARVDGCIVF